MPHQSHARLSSHPASIVKIPLIEKIYIAIDLGSTCSSVSYLMKVATTSEPQVYQEPVLHSTRSVHFADQPQVRTQIAAGKSDEGFTRLLFGREVDQGLVRAQHQIRPCDVMKWFKVGSFDTSTTGMVDRERLEAQMARLPLQFKAHRAGEREWEVLSCIGLYSEFLGYLWRSTLR
jgi:hypothetical protein